MEMTYEEADRTPLSRKGEHEFIIFEDGKRYKAAIIAKDTIAFIKERYKGTEEKAIKRIITLRYKDMKVQDAKEEIHRNSPVGKCKSLMEDLNDMENIIKRNGTLKKGVIIKALKQLTEIIEMTVQEDK